MPPNLGPHLVRQVAELKAEVARLKYQLDPDSFRQHPKVKLLAATPAPLLCVVRCGVTDA
ncbi:MAG: hypothetical protein WBN89_07455 [Prochlorococcaceae cyanobacterium]